MTYIHDPREAQLRSSLQLLSGQGCAWALTGPAGFGKTTLLRWLATEAAVVIQPARIAHVVCSPRVEAAITELQPGLEPIAKVSPGGRKYPDDHALLAVAEILTQFGALPGGPTEEPERRLVMDPQRWRSLGGRLVVEGALELIPGRWAFVWEQLKGLAETLAGDEPELRRVMNTLQVALMKAIAERPTLIIVDDAHFLDEQSCELLMRVARNIAKSYCMLVFAAREGEMREFARGELRHPLVGYLDNGIEQGWLNELKLTGWSKETVAAYIAGTYPSLERDQEFLDRFWGTTEGFPLFTTATLQLLEQRGHITEGEGGWRVAGRVTELEIPRRVEEVILERLNRIDQAVQATVQRASIEGEQFHSRIVAALTHPVESSDLQSWLEAAEHSYGLIETLARDPANRLGVLYEFSHALIHSVIYARIPEATQVELHRMVADELIRITGDNPTLLSAQIVHHSEVAEDWSRVVKYSLLSSQQAAKLNDWGTALRYAEKGLRHPDAATEKRTLALLKYVRSEALYRKGEWRQSLDGLRDVLGLADALPAPEIAADALMRMSYIANVQGQGEDAIQFAHDAVSAAEQAQDVDRQITALMVWHRALHALPIADRLPIYREAIRPRLKHLLEQARVDGNRAIEVRALRWLGRHSRTLEEHATSRDYLEEAWRIAQELPDYRTLVELAYLKVDFELGSGDRNAAWRTYETGISAARATNDQKMLSDMLSNYGGRLTEAGKYEEARQRIEEALRIGEQLELNELRSVAHGTLARVDQAVGNWRAAKQHHEHHLALAKAVKDQGGTIESMLGLATCHLRMGDPDRALRILADIEWPDPPRKRRERIEGALIATHAHFTIGDLTKVSEILDQAQALAMESGDSYWQAQVAFADGKLALDGRSSSTLTSHFDAALGGLEALSQKWPNALPLQREVERGRKLRADLAERGLLPANVQPS